MESTFLYYTTVHRRVEERVFAVYAFSLSLLYNLTPSLADRKVHEVLYSITTTESTPLPLLNLLHYLY